MNIALKYRGYAWRWINSVLPRLICYYLNWWIHSKMVRMKITLTNMVWPVKRIGSPKANAAVKVLSKKLFQVSVETTDWIPCIFAGKASKCLLFPLLPVCFVNVYLTHLKLLELVQWKYKCIGKIA